jgi:teichuronic acid biosynthesis glycosyltransferase TuaG
MKVSVVIPTFNSEKYISETLKSVIDQDCIDFEIVVVDGGSVDNTEKVVESFKGGFPNLRYIRNTNDQGPAHSRLVGIQSSVGEFIAFIDSDDIWFENKLEEQINFMSEKELDFTFTDYIKIADTGEIRSGIISGHNSNTYWQYLRRRGIANSTVIVRRSVIGDVWDDKISKSHGEDTLWWLLLMKHKNVLAVRFPHCLTKYRIAPEGLSRKVMKNQTTVWHSYRNELKLSFVQTVFYYTGYIADVAIRRLKLKLFPVKL